MIAWKHSQLRTIELFLIGYFFIDQKYAEKLHIYVEKITY